MNSIKNNTLSFQRLLVIIESNEEIIRNERKKKGAYYGKR